MNPPSKTCDLCRLPLGHRRISSAYGGKTFSFCCRGCRQVFQLLMESTKNTDPSSFRETEVFRKCQEMGIIPRTEEDLKDRAEMVADTVHRADDVPPSKPTSPSPLLSINLSVRDMWCPACAWVIVEVLKKTEGIGQANCDFSTDEVRCTYDPSMTSPKKIIGAIRHIGYDAVMPEESHLSRENRREFIRFAISAFFTVNVMMLSFALYTGFFTTLTVEAARKLSWPIFFMTTIVLGYGGKKIFHRCVAVTKTGAGMETLIATGSFCAYAYSTYQMLAGSIHLYFDTAAMLITLFLLGKRLERRAKDSIRKNLGKLSSLQPSKVRLITDRYPEGRYVSIGHLKKGHLFSVAENEVIPADGTIVNGEGTVDESSLTGEAIPLRKKPGAPLRAGTRVIQGVFSLKADGIGQESTLGQMIQIMETAMGSRTRLEGKTDQVLRWFVPTIIGLAMATGLLCLFLGLSADEAIVRSVTVMVISCPCAVGIAIPLARVAGFALAGKLGILVRNFSAFEVANQGDIFLFDKTGTITTGQWSLLEVIPAEPFTESDALALAATLESDSDHYIATAIKREAKRQGIETALLSQIKTCERGVSGRISGHDVKIGSKAFLDEEISSNKRIDLNHPKSQRLPRSLVYMGCDGKLCAMFVFGDRVKNGAAQVINRLKAMGHRTLLISGDGDETTQSVGRHVGFDLSHGEKLPIEKVNIIKHLQNEGHRVFMIGDGVNDAPALAQADLAMAVHAGNHLAEEAADVTLMRGAPIQVLDFLDLADKVNQKIGQNLTLSIVYNAVSIPVAMMGLLNPLIAVCAMFVSSLSVIGNTFLLTRKDLPFHIPRAMLKEDV